jgi:hypothetical protein
MTDREKRRGHARDTYRRIMADPVRAARRRIYSNGQRCELRGWLAAYKLERGCADCGYAEHAAALQLDHEGPKAAAISQLRTSVARMLAEIRSGQCVVRCANCHAVKTWREKQRGGVPLRAVPQPTLFDAETMP